MNVFTRAARVGSLSGAARQLGLSPAMATKHLDALEERLGVRLFQRSTRKLSLTEPGTLYLEACLRILPDLEQVETVIASHSVETTGVLRLSAPLSFGTRYVAPLLSAFSKRHPGLRIELGLDDRRVDLLGEGWDMTIRVGRLKDSGLTTRRLADCAMVVCAAPAYWSREGKPVRAAELASHNCLGFSIPSAAPAHEWCFGPDRELRIAVNGTLRANNGDALVAAAVCGMGVLYEPEFIVADAVRSGLLVPIALDIPVVDLGGIHVVHPHGRTPPAKVRAMIGFLVESFGTSPPWRLAVA